MENKQLKKKIFLKNISYRLKCLNFSGNLFPFGILQASDNNNKREQFIERKKIVLMTINLHPNEG